MRTDVVHDQIWPCLPFVFQHDKNIFVGIESTHRSVERKSMLPLSHGDSSRVGWKLEERYLGFRLPANGKNATRGNVDIECISHRVKQVDTIGPLKISPGVDVRLQLFSALRDRQSAQMAIHHTYSAQFEVVLQQRGTAD